jgi:hypothetical protein
MILRLRVFEKLEAWNEKNGEESLRNLGMEVSEK